MRPGVSSASGRALTGGVAVLLLALASTGAEAAAEPRVIPEALHGRWALERGGGCDRERVWVFGPDAARIGGEACAPRGVRAITPTRWYVDLDCGSGRAGIDVNRLGDGRLIVAFRPLGEGRFATRCEGAARGE